MLALSVNIINTLDRELKMAAARRRKKHVEINALIRTSYITILTAF